MDEISPVLASGACDEQAVIDVATRAAEPNVLDPEKPLGIVVPAGSELALPDLSAWRMWPSRKTGLYRPATVEAFSEYVGEHLDADASTIWVHPTSGRVVAILDDHHPEDAGWREWRVDLQLAHTAEWNYWIAQDRKMLSQVDFAEHIEGGLEEIAVPDGADLLEIAQTFQMTSGANFRSSVRLATGQQQFQYDEEGTATAGLTGQLKVPTQILLVIAPFFGEQPSRINARLRFRLNSGKLTLGYMLDRPEVIIRDALEKVAETLAEKFAHTYVGDAPARYLG
jgi:uncharacterized protein YfdQ (DUF2303 family)